MVSERLVAEVKRYLRATACCEDCLRSRNGGAAQTRLLNAIDYPREVPYHLSDTASEEEAE